MVKKKALKGFENRELSFQIMSNQLILPNGFTLLGDPIMEFQSVAFAVTVRAGSAWDPVGKYGMAAFICEMMLRGAGNRDTRQFLEDIDRIGIDRTESLTSSTIEFRGALLKENLVEALELYSDLLQKPVMPEKELEAGRQVLLQEVFSMEDNPEGKLAQALEEQFYGKAWGHDSDGDREGIESIAWNEVCSQYERLVTPNQCVMAIVGNFNWEKIARKVEELFSDWEKKEIPQKPEFARERMPIHIEMDSSQTQIGLVWETLPYLHPDQLKVRAAVSVLSGGMNSRLFNEVREKRGLCYDVDAYLQSLGTVAGIFCTASCRQENAQQTLDIILQEIRKLRNGITEEELLAFKARYRMMILTSRESCLGWASELIGDWVNFGRIRTNEELLKRVEDLTVKDINAYLAEHPVEDILLCTLGRKPLRL